MTAYNIYYTVGAETRERTAQIDAKNLESAKKKLGRKHGYKTGRMIKVKQVFVIGYY